MNHKNWIAALAACVLLPAGAQSLGYAPSSAEARQARENTQRDARMADAMEKARKTEDAKPVAAYIPAEKVEAADARVEKPRKPEVFVATIPGSKAAKKAEKKAEKKEAKAEPRKKARKA
jgi:hypothetical protein